MDDNLTANACASCLGALYLHPLPMCQNPVLHHRQHCRHRLVLVKTAPGSRSEWVLNCKLDAPHPGQMHWDGEHEWMS